MKVLVIGSGGREHALVATFQRQGHEVFCLPGNAGTGRNLSCPLNDYHQMAKLAKEHKIDLTVVGPEAPLKEGIKEVFKKQGLQIFAPSKKAALLEASKCFAKKFMQKYHIPTARFIECVTKEEAIVAAKKLFNKGVVIKPDGLTQGKGVTVCSTLQEAEQAIYDLQDDRIIVEEKLSGKESSLMVFCDGKTIAPMLAAQDYKSLLENNLGPNTGGLGAVAPLPFVDQKIVTNIVEKTNQGLQKEGILYQGVLYFGLMLTESGPFVLEYNCRFGDPETQAILPLLMTDLASIMFACCLGELSNLSIEWSDQTACTVVIYSEGYPKSYQVGFPIHGLENFLENTTLFHAGTKEKENCIRTNGGRVLSVTAIGKTLQEAIDRAYKRVETISFQGAKYRKDIGSYAR